MGLHRLSLANYCISVEDLVKMFSKYKGEPLNIMDVTAIPSECQPIMAYLRELYSAKFRLAQEVGHYWSTKPSYQDTTVPSVLIWYMLILLHAKVAMLKLKYCHILLRNCSRQPVAASCRQVTSQARDLSSILTTSPLHLTNYCLTAHGRYCHYLY